ncbi:MAG: N-6 DNA methylase [Lachnospiraceae bacterium]|nr:N-6 DNA methylase [Lachnospiraceae bacterium]
METLSAKNAFDEIRNFLAGRFMGATRDEFFLEEIIKLVFCKYSLNGENTSQLSEISLSSLYRKTFKSVLLTHSDIYEGDNCEIELDPVSIKFVDDKLNSIDLNNLGRDIIGDAYEIFIGDAIKGQSGQFFTPQNAAEALVEMIQPQGDCKVLDLTCGAGGFLVATANYWSRNSIDNAGLLYGVDKDNYLTRLAKIHLTCMNYDSKNIRCADSLVWDENLLGRRDEAYDIILTNPPFGVNIQAGTNKTLERFKLAYKYKKGKSGKLEITEKLNESVPPQVVFIEQCVSLVKKNGYIGIVVPESMISNKKYSYVVDYLFETCEIKAVIGMPDELFKTSGKGGTHTKTCLLVLMKKEKPENSNYSIFFAEAKWCGHDSRGRSIPKDDIPTIIENYNKYINNRDLVPSNLGFVFKRNDIQNSVLAPRAYVHTVTGTEHRLEDSHTLVTIGQLIDEGVLSVSTGNEVGKLAYGTGSIPFVRTSDISNWEIKSDPKHLVSEVIYNDLAAKQDVRSGDILMVKDGSYLIGTCAMITEYDTKIVYQSHLYKIRVTQDNSYGLNNYYLLAALSSNYVRQQILANTYSQDIINSLGDRLKDLIIPISKKTSKIDYIASMVKESILESIKARELSKRVRSEVLF